MTIRQLAQQPELLQQVLSQALDRGADFAEIFVEERYRSGLSFLDGRPKDATSGRDFGAGIRAFYGNNAVYSYTNDLSGEGLLQAARTVADAGKAQEPTCRVVPFRKVEAASVTQTKIHPMDVPKGSKIGLMAQCDRHARAFDPLIQQVEVNLNEWVQEILVVNSQGVWAEDVRPYTRLVVTAIAKDGQEQQTGSEGPGNGQGFEFIESLDLKAISEAAASTAVTMLKADYAPSGKMPVVIDKGFGGVIFHEACGHLLETTSVAKGASRMCGKLGEKVAHPCVTAVDDGTLADRWGSLTVDDEGRKTQKTVLIENGVLKAYMVDELGARKTGYALTGSGRRESYRYPPTSRMRNTYIAPGDSSLEEMIGSIDYGLYAKKMGGGSVSPGTGDFNFSVREAYLIRDGRIAEPVRGATLIGNGVDILTKIDMVGRDLELAEGMCGSTSGSIPTTVGQPAIRVAEIVVGGRN